MDDLVVPLVLIGVGMMVGAAIPGLKLAGVEVPDLSGMVRAALFALGLTLVVVPLAAMLLLDEDREHQHAELGPLDFLGPGLSLKQFAEMNGIPTDEYAASDLEQTGVAVVATLDVVGFEGHHLTISPLVQALVQGAMELDWSEADQAVVQVYVPERTEERRSVQVWIPDGHVEHVLSETNVPLQEDGCYLLLLKVLDDLGELVAHKQARHCV